MWRDWFPRFRTEKPQPAERLLSAALCPSCLMAGGFASSTCACRTATLPAASPRGKAIVLVSLAIEAINDAAAVLQAACDGPTRYPLLTDRNSLACREHGENSVWLLRASWRDMFGEGGLTSRRGRLMRALSIANGLVIEAPVESRLDRARRVAAGIPASAYELLDTLLNMLDISAARPSFIARLGAPGAEIERRIAHLGQSSRVFDNVGEAVSWLVAQGGVAPQRSALAPSTTTAALTLPPICNISVVDWAGDSGRQFLWGVHRETVIRCGTSNFCRIAVQSAHPLDVHVTNEARLTGQWDRLFGFSPNRQPPIWTAKGFAGDTKREIRIVYDSDVHNASLVIAGFGEDPRHPEGLFAKALERHWTRSVPLIAIADPQTLLRRRRNSRLRWPLPVDQLVLPLNRGNELRLLASAMLQLSQLANHGAAS